MVYQLIFNIIIAILWTFLQNDLTLPTLFVGYAIGIIILIILRKFFEFDFYLRRVWAIIKLIWLFIIELVKANLDLVKVVLSPKLKHQPGIVAVETHLKTDLEITLLAALITLTPGTISMDFSQDSKTIYVHTIDVGDKDQLIEDIHNSFERAIMEVTQ